jgi:hypothetical protein
MQLNCPYAIGLRKFRARKIRVQRIAVRDRSFAAKTATIE